MREHFSALVVMLLAYVGLVGCNSGTWKQIDMSSRRSDFVEVDLASGSPVCRFLPECRFELHYFEGRQKPTGSPADREKVLLYIPGGPGDIVDREKHALSFARMDTKLIYLDVRGTGYSVIPESNDYDQFLRAKYVMEDIEALRRKIFNECGHEQLSNRFEGVPAELNCKVQTPRKWDAIYAHSWGTVVAQMYAQKYGDRVKRLILSAPVSRAHIDTGAARRRRLVQNLIEIFRQGGAGGVACSWPTDGEIFKMGPEQRRLLAEKFCFLTETNLKQIEQKFMSLLIEVEGEYGSTAFVGRFYSLVLQDNDFRKRYRYRVEFYKALRALEWFGGGELPGFRFEKQVREKKIDAALFLGYYLLLEPLPTLPDNPDKPPFRCDDHSPFIQLISSSAMLNNFVFCKRIDDVFRDIGLQDVYDDSLRAQTVFGVFDGIARWIFHIQGKDGPLKQDSCFKVDVLQKIAVEKLFPEKKAVRDVVKRIGLTGVNLDSEICPWDASEYKHDVKTLILTGESDPITTGNQARYVLEYGLTPGKRVLIQFPGAGHLLTPQLKISKTNGKEPSDAEIADQIADSLGGLLYSFISLTNNVEEFIHSEVVERHLTRLGATLIQ
jgi:pimeloyl-ACP methyl ester carboxylesterase